MNYAIYSSAICNHKAELLFLTFIFAVVSKSYETSFNLEPGQAALVPATRWKLKRGIIVSGVTNLYTFRTYCRRKIPTYLSDFKANLTTSICKQTELRVASSAQSLINKV